MIRAIYIICITLFSFNALCQDIEAEGKGLQFFARDSLFPKLIADPKYPHFAASYQYYTSGADNSNTFKATIGKPFSFVRGETDGGMRWETGINVGVFSTFDLDTQAFNIINADYWVGMPLTFQKGAYSLMFRIYHQSSHLGDEYMLHHPRVRRVNLSYEVVDFLLSYEVSEWLRLYGGGGYRISGEPHGYGSILYQAGAELSFDSLQFPLIFALDLQSGEEWDYVPAISLVAGVEISPEIYITLDYYNGHSDNGQFYVHDINRLACSLRFYY